MRLLSFLLCLIFVVNIAIAQSPEVPIDSADYIEVDTSSILEEILVLEEEFHEDSDSSHTEVLNDSSLVILDSTFFKDIDTTRMSALVKALIRDNIYWVGIDSNFIIFDSMTVNPYGFKAEKFTDTVAVSLYPDKLGDNRLLWSMPLKRSDINSDFGLRHYKWHYGTDLDLEIGDSVLACFDGVVRISKFNPGGYGHYVMVRHHNGLETLYGHLSERLVRVGQHVKAGELIGWGGNTGRSSGPHLHFEVRYHGEAINPNNLYDFSKHKLKGPVYTVTPKDFKYIKALSAAKYHRIRSGDTLSGLAVKYHTSVRRICQLNRISTRTVLRLGKTLRVR